MALNSVSPLACRAMQSRSRVTFGATSYPGRHGRRVVQSSASSDCEASQMNRQAAAATLAVPLVLLGMTGTATGAEGSNPGQTVKQEAKSKTYDGEKANIPSVRPPGLTDTAVGRTVPEKEATGGGNQTSSKF